MKKGKNLNYLLAAILILGILLISVGCSSTPKEGSKAVDTKKAEEGQEANAEKEEDKVEEDARDPKDVKETIILAITGEPTTLDSAKANDRNTFSITCNVYDGLIRQEQDGSLVPGLAETWEYNEDNTEITFKLREGVKFHNGETMTADDVVFSFERSLASPSTARITGSMEKMEKIDENHVKLTLFYAYGPVEGCLASVNCGIISKAAVEADPDGFERNPVATGPYMFEKWESGNKIVFTAFEDYYREPASIKSLTYQLVSDTSAALIALETGDVDMIVTTQAADRDNIMNNDDLFYDEVSSSSIYFVAFNNTDGIFADNPLLRKAVAHAIDRESVVIGATEGVGLECPSAIPATCFGTPKDFEGAEYNPELAKELLVQAGYPDGLSIKIPVMESGAYPKVAEVVAEQLNMVGFDAQVDLMERTAFLQDVYTDCKYEICVNGYTALSPDADFIMYMRYHSDHLGGGNNFVMVNNAKLDALLEQGRFSTDPAAREQAYLEACEILRDEAVLVPILSPVNGVACRADLKGVKGDPLDIQYVYNFRWEN